MTEGWLGLRMVVASGRRNLATMATMAVGIAVGVVLLLFSLLAMPALQGRIDRYAWHRTDASSPATQLPGGGVPDGALWLAVTDRYDGRDLIRVHVAALGPRPPVPPGVERLPGPGEVVLSPALAELVPTVPDDQLRDRFPGRVVATIGPEGLITPDELVAIVGHTPDQMRNTVGAYEIRGIERPGEPLDLGPIVRGMVMLLAVFVVGPVVVFIALLTRIGAAQRERRFAAIRLAGATRWQTAVLAATETALAGVAGSLLGWCAYLGLRPLLARVVTVEATPFPLDDLSAPAWQTAAVLVAGPLIGVAATLVTMHRLHITPLGVRHGARRRTPRAWRLYPLAGGIVGVVAVTRYDNQNVDGTDRAIAMLSLLAPLSILVGLVLSGPWLCLWVSRGLAAVSRRATTLIAARRIASDPYVASHAVIGVALAAFVITIGAARAPEEVDAVPPGVTVLDPGVVAIRVTGAPEAALAPLLTDGVVVARAGGWDRRLFVACADMARVTSLSCPLPAEATRPDRGLFNASGFGEAGPTDDGLPIEILFVPTDGTPAAEERVKTLAAAAVPHSRSRTARDFAPGAHPIEGELAEAAFGWVGSGFLLALLFVVVVAACSLTVSVVTAHMDRRRAFAVLRASGVRLGELRRIALLETAAPLVFTMLGGVVTAVVVVYLTAPREEWRFPGMSLLFAVGVAAVVALAVSLVTWPMVKSATRHETIRFE
jgi:hypothetical protein